MDNNDAAPLYVFDSSLTHKTIPNTDRVMSDDLHLLYTSTYLQSLTDAQKCLIGSTFKPLAQQWLLSGGPLSGTPIHDHPMTIGWNVLVEGEKLWACFPPAEGDPEKLDSFLLVDEDDNDVSAREWFHLMQGKLPKDCIVMWQKPGEVVFLPSGWFHVVLNLEVSTAISNSICTVYDFKRK